MSLFNALGRRGGVRRVVVCAALGLVGPCVLAASASAATVNVTLAPVGISASNSPEFNPQIITVHPGDNIALQPIDGFTGGLMEFVNPDQSGGAGCASGPSPVAGFPNPVTLTGGSTLVPISSAALGTYYFFDGDSGPCLPSSFRSAGGSASLLPSEGEIVVVPSQASPGASLTATVPVSAQFKSVTLSTGSATFGNCVGGSSTGNVLGFPNGTCSTPAFTVTNNGTVPESLDVQATNATPSDNGTPWALIGSGTPGADQYQLGNGSEPFSTTATPDVIAATLPPLSDVSEALTLVGPSRSSDASPSFSTAVTWTAV
jgi:hypothetical protein